MTKFQFNYSAPTETERKEIEYIQKQYKPVSQKELNLQRLRKLDRKVKNTPMIVSLVLGIVGVLIFGLGLTMLLEWDFPIYGIILTAVGCIPMGFAYFSYVKLYNKLKNKYSQEILKLSGELLNESSEEH